MEVQQPPVSGDARVTHKESDSVDGVSQVVVGLTQTKIFQEAISRSRGQVVAEHQRWSTRLPTG